MILPSNGRIVWFTPASGDGVFEQYGRVPMAAMVCHVWGARMVNLLVTYPDGTQRAETSVTLLQDDDAPPINGRFAEWMPYQIGQAKKHEAGTGAA
jgi:hypothetical protein